MKQPTMATNVCALCIFAACWALSAIAPAQSIVAWGDNSAGQCNVPPLPAGLGYSQVVAGDFYTAARRSDGAVLVWGDNTNGVYAVPPLPAGLAYVELAAGGYHLLARRSDGSVVAWGDNSMGQCIVPPFPPALTCVEVAAGRFHSIARLSDGSLVAWGRNVEAQCIVPPLPAGVTYVEAKGGGYHTLARRSDGTFTAWGLNNHNQCFVFPPSAGTTWVGLAAGHDHSILLRSDGSIFGVPAAGPFLTYTALAAGGYHSLALRSDGVVVAVGDNTFGQTNVPPLPGSSYLELEGGQNHSVARIGLTASFSLVGTGCGGPGPGKPTLTTSLPRLGFPIVFNLSLGTPNASGFLYASPGPAASTSVGSGCFVRVNLATAVPALPVFTNAAGQWLVTALVPAAVTLEGAQLVLQAALFPTPSAPGFDLTNGIVVTLGY